MALSQEESKESARPGLMSMRAVMKYRMLGLMSGTSLDGLDVVCVEFRKDKRWSFKIIEAETFPYNKKWSHRLGQAHKLSGEALLQLHASYGRFIGESCSRFIRKKRIGKLDAIASHGHTIFHQPEKSFTFQLGDGAAIYAETGFPVVCDFRSLDVHLGGEGAPLVPAGDRFLFPSADVCLNMGGIANLSLEVKGKRRAFDICFCNMALNYLARKSGRTYDRGGRMAAQGNVIVELLEQLTEAYSAVRKKRKSLGREFFEETIQPLLDQRQFALSDRLRTVCESIAEEIERSLPAKGRNFQMLTTGGGAWNGTLVDVLRSRLAGRASVILPPRKIIDFKEAVIFAFLGVLRLRNEENVLSSVTRSRRDSCSGTLIGATLPSESYSK